MTDRREPHAGLHSEVGAVRGEHPGRAANPVVKVHDLGWLEFEKPDLEGAERFAHAFGFGTALRSSTELHLRGSDAGPPCVLIRKGPRSRFLGPAFRAADSTDVLRLAETTGRTATKLPEVLGSGLAVDLTDPGGLRVRVVADATELPALPAQQPLRFNFGHDLTRSNATQRPPREPAKVQRLGHVVVQTTTFVQSLNWYLEHLGLIVSDFLYYPRQRARGPVMAFIRCDRGATPSDHHTLAMALGPNRYVHSAYQVADLDALAAGGEHLLDCGYQRSWGIGRHIQGSQIFDYWRDPDGFMVEHFSDGDLFDCTIEPGWAPMTASGLAQWGPPATKDFLGIKPGPQAIRELRTMLGALRADNEFDFARLRGLLKVASS
jgi:hypothetical protein